MEPPQLPQSPAAEAFFDASDQLPPTEQEEATSVSSIASDLDPPGDGAGPSVAPPQTPPGGLRRRSRSFRSAAASRRILADSKASISDSQVSSEASSSGVERRGRSLLASKEHVREGADSAISGVSSDRVPVGDGGGRENDVAKVEGSSGDVEISTDSTGVDTSPPSPSGLLVSIAGLVIKAIGFQMSILVSSVTFPLWLLYCSFLLVTDPFQTLKRGRDHVSQKLLWFCTVLRDRIGPLVFEKLTSQRALGRWVLRVALGCFWSFYVCLILLVCLVSAFVFGRLLMGSMVEEPLRFTQELSFDYTKTSPVAVVPIMPCRAVECGLECNKIVGSLKGGSGRLIPLNHKLQVTVSLTLPESDYNQKLGVFQVKAEILSANGKIIASSGRPCMLLFKSPPIQFLKTLFKSGPLLAGYSSESQTLNLKMEGFTEGSEPTACIRVTLERRAEYRPGSGVPEIYAACIRLESELPLFKKFIWNWRRTLFVWISIGLFNSELLFILVCCAPLIIPRSRQGNASSGRT